MADFLVFGYGSLLDQDDAEKTVSEIRYLYNALLPGYRIACTWRSATRDGGVADVVSDDTSHVWGAVYRVSAAGLEMLDKREGVGISVYRRECMTVFRDGDENNPVKVAIYTVVNKSEEPVPCTCKYRDLVLRGARGRHLPDDYISLLRNNLIMHDSEQ